MSLLAALLLLAAPARLAPAPHAPLKVPPPPRHHCRKQVIRIIRSERPHRGG